MPEGGAIRSDELAEARRVLEAHPLAVREAVERAFRREQPVFDAAVAAWTRLGMPSEMADALLRSVLEVYGAVRILREARPTTIGTSRLGAEMDRFAAFCADESVLTDSVSFFRGPAVAALCAETLGRAVPDAATALALRPSLALYHALLAAVETA